MTDCSKFVHDRTFTRIPIQIDTIVKTVFGSYHYEHARDIGMRGIFLYTNETIAIGTECEIELKMGSPEDSGVFFEVKGRVVRCEEEGMAIEFTGLTPEAYGHLKLLVLYNAPDSHRAEEEIGDHMGISSEKELV